MNNLFYDHWVKSRFKDLRKKEALKWFNDNFFIALYDYYDNYVTSFEDVESITTAFNIPTKKVLYLLRTDSCITINNHKYKMYLVQKNKIQENYKRRR